MRGVCQVGRRPGFTVVEVMMVVLLLAAILSLVVINFFSAEGSLDKRPAIDQIQRATAEGHRLARTHLQNVMLYFDTEAQSLLLRNEHGEELSRFDLPQGGEFSITFYRVLPEKDVTEEPFYEPEEDPVPTVTFAPYGAAMPFYVLFEGSKEARMFRFDPFSGLSWEKEDVL